MSVFEETHDVKNRRGPMFLNPKPFNANNISIKSENKLY